MRLTRAHLWAGLLLGATSQVALSCGPCPDDDDPTHIVFEDGQYVPEAPDYCELDDVVVTLEGDVVYIDYLADDGYRYRAIYHVVEREWDQG